MTNARFEIRRKSKWLSRRKQSFWVVTIGDNGEILQSSEMLSSKVACYENIEAIRRVVIVGDIVDTTI